MRSTDSTMKITQAHWDKIFGKKEEKKDNLEVVKEKTGKTTYKIKKTKKSQG